MECDRKLPEEKQTVFKLKNLAARELAEIEDNMSVSIIGDNRGELNLKAGSQTLRILSLGIKSWENFNDGEGKPIEFNQKELHHNWDYLQPDWRRELANAITEQARLTEPQVKN